MINNFENHGHYFSDVDPINIKIGKLRQKIDELGFKFTNLEDTNIPKQYYDVVLPENFPYVDQNHNTPKKLHQKLKKLYCDKISF